MVVTQQRSVGVVEEMRHQPVGGAEQWETFLDLPTTAELLDQLP